MATRSTVNEQITEAILSRLDDGEIPWTKPWVVNSTGVVSHATGKPYSLRNRLLLHFGGEYATFHQVKASGGSVRKGERSQRVFFSSYIQKTDDDGEVKSEYYLLKPYCVFRVGTQTEGVEPKYRDKWEHGGLPKEDSEIVKLVTEYCERSKVKLINAGSECFYSPSDDAVQCVGSDAFSDRSQYWHTMFHELVHSTGHPERLNRTHHEAWGDSTYAKEELVADIGACLCLGRLGISTDDCIVNSTAYIQAWRKRISDFKPSDFSEAVRQAELACDYIFNTKQGETNEQHSMD